MSSLEYLEQSSLEEKSFGHLADSIVLAFQILRNAQFELRSHYLTTYVTRKYSINYPNVHHLLEVHMTDKPR